MVIMNDLSRAKNPSRPVVMFPIYFWYLCILFRRNGKSRLHSIVNQIALQQRT